MHPYHSERILASSQALEPAATIAGMHHERLDGSGYHRSCRARDLPPAARLLAAADAYQAMTQHRPHRPALGREAAADELTRGRAGDGDPLVLPGGETVEPTGKRVTQRSADAAVVGDGLVVEHRFHYDQVEVLAQLGLDLPSLQPAG